MITTFYVSLVALLAIYISFLAIKERRDNQIRVGTGKNIRLASFAAAHNNLVSFSSLYFLMSFGCELVLNFSTTLIWVAGALFTLGRFLHGHGLCVTELAKKPNLKFRMSGMFLTILSTVILALIAVYKVGCTLF